MDKYNVVLHGITPLLMHADNIDGQTMIQNWLLDPDNKKKSKAGDDRTPEWTWKTYCYNDGKNLVMPSDNLRKCMLRAGSKVPTGKRQGTFKAESVAGILISDFNLEWLVRGKPVSWEKIDKIEGEFSKHVSAVRAMGFDLLVKRAAIGQSKHVRVRPVFHDWSIRFGLTVIEDQITDQVLRRIFDVAGQYMGLGDWRPGCKTPGPWGQFKADIEAV